MPPQRSPKIFVVWRPRFSNNRDSPSRQVVRHQANPSTSALNARRRPAFFIVPRHPQRGG
jgi:hypothetical protein